MLQASEYLTNQDVSRIMAQILAQHVDQHEMTGQSLQKAFKSYINQFDPYRIYLLESEAAPYEQMSDRQQQQLIAQYRSGDFSAFKTLNQTIQQAILRARTLRLEIEKNGHPQKLTTSSDNDLSDPDLSRPFAATLGELKVRNRQVLATALETADSSVKQTVAQQIANYEDALRQSENLYLYRDSDNQPLSSREAENLSVMHILKALTKSLDAHTSVYSTAEANSVKMRLLKEFKGIGVSFQQRNDGTVVINKLLPGTQASQSGLVKVNDQLLKVDGQKVTNRPLSKLTEQIRNGTSSTVQLSLLRPATEGGGQPQEITVSLPKEEITLQQERVDIYSEKFGRGIIGVLTLHSFYQGEEGVSSEEDLRKAIAELKKQGPLEGLVLDLRENGGGFLNQAVKVAGLFITNGVVVMSKYFSGEEHIYRDLDSSSIFNGPLVVLTSRATASAAEIVAQALQDYGVALVVGDTATYGKGTIQNQTITNGDQGLAFKVTVGKYYTVSGKTPQINGVEADIVVPSPYSDAHIGERYLDSTITADSIAPSYSDDLMDVNEGMKTWYLRYYMPTLQRKQSLWQDMVGNLREKSTKRQNSSAPSSPAEQGQWQRSEAINIVKDMITLENATVNR
jgi:carboxyl-terminal processing protease